jgi:6-pyruvoyl-tetrahydropterin synthase
MVGVRLLGSRKIASDGYVVDFGDIKKVTRAICKQLNEHFLCPTLSDVLDIIVSTETEGSPSTVTISCQDGSVFVFPKSDCAMLPIVHATAEELAIYLWSRILEGLHAGYLVQRGIHTMEVVVTEAVGQQAVFRHEISKTVESGGALDIPSFIMKGEVKPAPCPSAPMQDESFPTKTALAHTSAPGSTCCDMCLSQSSFFQKLEILAAALKTNGITYNDNGRITAKDLENMINNSNL